MTWNERVISDFGDEWQRFNYLNNEDSTELEFQFDRYFEPVPDNLQRRDDLVAADFGAGSGRWSFFLMRKCHRLYVVEPSTKAIDIAKRRLGEISKITYLNEPIERNTVPVESLDFAICLGVLHVVDDIQVSLDEISAKLKEGGYFLGYVYYSFENRPKSYFLLWKLSDYARRRVSRFPRVLKFAFADLIAALVYFPVSRTLLLLHKLGLDTHNYPLNHYEALNFKMMRNDALDRFGTTVENRFSKKDLVILLKNAGFDEHSIIFSENEPFWTFCARKKSSTVDSKE
jgi:SAM-dependent methyltransferase